MPAAGTARSTSSGVTIWYTAPTAIRMLMRAGTALPGEYDLSALRFVASVGEPLNPEAVVWGRDALGLTIHDNWWQTETGGIMIANYAACDVHPGSMGRPMPGITATVLARGDDGRAGVAPDGSVAEVAPDEIGELALRPGWPSMFRGYLNDEERYAKCFAGGWYLYRGPRAPRRRRLVLVRGPRRRRHQVRRAPDRPVRGRERPDGAPGGRRGRA